MSRRIAVALLAASLGLWSPRASADDPAQEAHAIMRRAMLDRAMGTARAMAGDREMAPASAAARRQLDRMRRAEAERDAHRRALEHGARRSGAGRTERDARGAPGGMHGGSGGNSWGTDCQDAAGNSRTRDMHDGGMPGRPMPGGMKASPGPSGR